MEGLTLIRSENERVDFQVSFDAVVVEELHEVLDERGPAVVRQGGIGLPHLDGGQWTVDSGQWTVSLPLD